MPIIADGYGYLNISREFDCCYCWNDGSSNRMTGVFAACIVAVAACVQTAWYHLIPGSIKSNRGVAFAFVVYPKIFRRIDMNM